VYTLNNKLVCTANFPRYMNSSSYRRMDILVFTGRSKLIFANEYPEKVINLKRNLTILYSFHHHIPSINESPPSVIVVPYYLLSMDKKLTKYCKMLDSCLWLCCNQFLYLASFHVKIVDIFQNWQKVINKQETLTVICQTKFDHVTNRISGTK
jgi:hypothetical protein